MQSPNQVHHLPVRTEFRYIDVLLKGRIPVHRCTAPYLWRVYASDLMLQISGAYAPDFWSIAPYFWSIPPDFWSICSRNLEHPNRSCAGWHKLDKCMYCLMCFPLQNQLSMPPASSYVPWFNSYLVFQIFNSSCLFLFFSFQLFPGDLRLSRSQAKACRCRCATTHEDGIPYQIYPTAGPPVPLSIPYEIYPTAGPPVSRSIPYQIYPTAAPPVPLNIPYQIYPTAGQRVPFSIPYQIYPTTGQPVSLSIP